MRKQIALIACLVLASQSAFAQVTISGTRSQVTTSPLPQLDPSISGDIVVYLHRMLSGFYDIHYTDLSSGLSFAVTNDAVDQFLHDVSGNYIVYTDYTDPNAAQAWVYDLSVGMSVPLFPTSKQQLDPTVDGNVVAFEVYPAGIGTNADIAIVDLDTDTITLLAPTAQHEGRPTVGGGFVVFERGNFPVDENADIVLYELATGTETVIGTGLDAHTDGRRVSWTTGAPGSASGIVVHDTLTGTTTTITDPSRLKYRARVSGDMLAYSDWSLAFDDRDIVLVHLPSGASVRVPGATGANEELNDLDGNRLVYTSNEPGNFDIFLYEFEIDGLEPPPPVTDNPCESTSGLVEVFTQTFVRDAGKPEEVSASFAFDAGGLDVGAVVVDNSGCASAEVWLNGERALSPDDFDSEMQCDFAGVPLLANNALDVELRSRPGCEVTVTVYAVAPEAAATLDAAALTCDTSSGTSAAPLGLFALALLAVRRRKQRG